MITKVEGEVSLLREAGLTANEARLFIALCKTGPSSVSSVAAEAGMHRAAAYNTLNQLSAKGMASWATVNKKRVYRAASPAELRARIEERMESTKTVLEELTQRLQASNTGEEAPGVSAFFGIEGLKSILTEELEAVGSEQTIRAMHALPQIAELAPVFVPQWHKKRAKRKIVFKALFDNSSASLKRSAELAQMPLTEVRHTDYEALSPVTYHVAGDKLAIMSTSPQSIFGIVVQSREIASSFTESFERAWKRARKA